MPYGQPTIANTATQLSAVGGGGHFTTITALSTNTEPVFLGDDSSVTTANGQPIYPGQNVAVPRPPSQNYLISASGGQKVGWNS